MAGLQSMKAPQVLDQYLDNPVVLGNDIPQILDLALHLRRKASWLPLLCHELLLYQGAHFQITLYAQVG